MTFLEKLTMLMDERKLNKSTLSASSGIPYTTIDGLYKKGYENAKLSTIKKLAEFFDTSIDFLMIDEITDRNYRGNLKDISTDIPTAKELSFLQAYRAASPERKKLLEALAKELEQ